MSKSVLSHVFSKIAPVCSCPKSVPLLSQACPTPCWDREVTDITIVIRFCPAIFDEF
jgi:hypothetical protein